MVGADSPLACIRRAKSACEGEDLDEVADRLNDAIRVSADGESSLTRDIRPELLKLCGAKGIRTPDLLDANESRYQLRHSP
jgi:hypothetical protein